MYRTHINTLPTNNKALSNKTTEIDKQQTQQKKLTNFLLEHYYDLCFPYKLIIDFFSFCNKKIFINRRFTFNYGDNTFINNYHFADEKNFKTETLARVPTQLLVGALMSEPHSVFKPKPSVCTRELILDIDLTDYSDVRSCCKNEKKCCSDCWEYIKIVYKLVDEELREVYKFKNILWVFSGRRGVHCYVLDQLAHEQRNIIHDLMITRKTADDTYKLNEIINFQSSFIKRALPKYNQKFISLCVKKQKLFATDYGIDMLIESCDIIEMKNKMSLELTPLKNKGLSSEAVFDKYQKFLNNQGNEYFNRGKIFLMLRIFSPRFDTNVTLQPDHLLKCPFSLNIKTGNLAVPFDINQDFDPIKDAIKLDILYKEIKSTKDVTKTLLQQPLKFFEKFLVNLRNNEGFDDG